MSRSILQQTKEQFYAQSTEDVFLVLLEIDNWLDPSTPIRLALNQVDVTANASGSTQTYLGTYFAIELPSESADSIQSVRLAIDNVDQRMVEAIRNTVDPPSVRMWIVSRSDKATLWFDSTEAGPFRFVLESVDYDALQIRGELVFEEIVNRRWPQHDFTPSNAPGLF